MSVSNFIFILFFVSCSFRLHSDERSVIELINVEHQKRAALENGSSFQSYDNLVYDMRKKAAQLYGIDADTAKITSFIVIDLVSFEGGKTNYGEMIVNDTIKYFYQRPFLSGRVEKYKHPISSESTILNYLKTHRFEELEALANEKGERLSGSFFFYIGMYEKKMDSIYVNILPAFISNR